MTSTINPWPSLPSGCGAPDQGGGQTCDAAEGARNLCVRIGRQWKLNLTTFNTRTLWGEARLAGLSEELRGIAWDIIAFSEVRRTGEAYTVLTNGNVLYYRRLPDKREFGVGFIVHEDIAGNIDEFYSIYSGVIVVVIKLNRRHRMKVVRAYAPGSSHDDEEIEPFYEGVELAMRKVQTQYTVVMGDFNAKVGKKQAGEKAIGNYGIGSENTRGAILVEFAEMNRLRIVNTFFRKRSNMKWTWQSPN